MDTFEIQTKQAELQETITRLVAEYEGSCGVLVTQIAVLDTDRNKYGTTRRPAHDLSIRVNLEFPDPVLREKDRKTRDWDARLKRIPALVSQAIDELGLTFRGQDAREHFVKNVSAGLSWYDGDHEPVAFMINGNVSFREYIRRMAPEFKFLLAEEAQSAHAVNSQTEETSQTSANQSTQSS